MTMRKPFLTVGAAGGTLGLILLLGLIGLVTARALSAQPSDGAAITDVVWYWRATLLNDGTVIRPADPTRYTLELQADSQAALRADCNRGGGSYTLDGDRIDFGPFATTLIACPPGSLDSHYLQQLDQVARYRIIDGDLFFALESDRGWMRFAAMPMAAPTTPVASATMPATVTGVVTYRERIALPPDVVVTVRIEDTSRADAPAILIGEQAIRDPGQVPIPFAVPYDPRLIDPRSRYTLRVRIEDASGRLLWINTQAYPVITGGNPTSDIEIVVMRVG